MLYMCESYIIPFMVKEISAYKAIETDSAFALKRKVKLTEYLDSLSIKLDDLREKYALITGEYSSLDEGLKFRSDIVPLLSDIKSVINDYEKIASKEIYTLPTYPEMLY